MVASSMHIITNNRVSFDLPVTACTLLADSSETYLSRQRPPIHRLVGSRVHGAAIRWRMCENVLVVSAIADSNRQRPAYLPRRSPPFGGATSGGPLCEGPILIGPAGRLRRAAVESRPRQPRHCADTPLAFLRLAECRLAPDVCRSI